ncbi:uncharacterized protein LOC114737746 [Neltuma alba]|uniref:uncharacterized protein LOC114737746 n=1 Tax=Neltuma alba TaxID=207710 RepID=UPI0010A2E16A|nr:uncharacterized protein LOC114737746 [Prosopis alba]
MAAFLAKREWRKMWNNLSEASDPMKQDTRYFMENFEARKKQTPASDVQNNLKQEILQLERRLQDQSEVRCGLERALGYKPSSFVDSNDIVLPEPATKLIKEIAVLELEVAYLEQHLLSLYRKAFHQQLSSVSPSAKDERWKLSLRTPSSFLEVSKPCNFPNAGSSAVRYNAQELEAPAGDQYNGNGSKEKLFDSSIYRCHSSLSHSSAFTARTSPAESLAKAVYACHSRQLSMMEYPETASSSMISLAEHVGTRMFDHFPDTPNRISENMVKCIAAIYCKLAEPPMAYHGISSPSSSFSSMSGFSVGGQGNIWSPGFRNNSFFDVGLDNPFPVERSCHHAGPYSSMFEVSWIYRDSLQLGDTENLLQSFRSLTCRLEEVDPGKLNHEEKLAFWINVHNALVMDAYLAHGIPQNNVKRVLLLMKASYNVGGRPVSADTIQNTILGCRTSRPGQWVRLLLSPWTKLRSGDRREAYAIERAEPLLHFALSSGNHSDPAVRVYTAKRVMEELQVAKEEYIGATLGIRKDEKIMLPKLVEAYAKDSGLSRMGVMEMLQQQFNKCHTPKSSPNAIHWIPITSLSDISSLTTSSSSPDHSFIYLLIPLPCICFPALDANYYLYCAAFLISVTNM